MRAYALYRPIGPFTWPSQHRDKVKDIVNFDHLTFVEQIGRNSFGYIEFTEDIPIEDLTAYDFVVEKAKNPAFEHALDALERAYRANDEERMQKVIKVAEEKYGFDGSELFDELYWQGRL